MMEDATANGEVILSLEQHRMLLSYKFLGYYVQIHFVTTRAQPCLLFRNFPLYLGYLRMDHG